MYWLPVWEKPRRTHQEIPIAFVHPFKIIITTAISSIVILRHRHLMLRVLDLRVVVNGTNIFECRERQPLVIEGTEPGTTLLVTNGFHYSRELVVPHKPGTHFFEVESFIDDLQLITGLLMVALFFATYILTGVRLFLFLANAPVLVFLFFFYIKRNSFIQVHHLVPDQEPVRN
jgi:hypothetical protein